MDRLVRTKSQQKLLLDEDQIEDLKNLFPRQWAVFQQLDIGKNGVLDEYGISYMCNELGVPEMSDFLFEILDRDGDGLIGIAT